MERRSGIGARLWLSLLEPVDDWVPVFGLRIIEGGVVRAGGEDEQVGAASAAGDEFVRHVHLEEAIVVALDNEDGESAAAEGFAS